MCKETETRRHSSALFDVIRQPAPITGGVAGARKLQQFMPLDYAPYLPILPFFVLPGVKLLYGPLIEKYYNFSLRRFPYEANL